ncbi:mCG1046237 [Mus musculus]|nr:mCG1046237 [Mus musculus]
MIHRFRMEAVEHMMSKATQMSQNAPKGQYPATSATAFQGMTSNATKRSETARDTMKMLVILARRWRLRTIAAHTRTLPSKVQTIKRVRRPAVTTCAGPSGAAEPPGASTCASCLCNPSRARCAVPLRPGGSMSRWVARAHCVRSQLRPCAPRKAPSGTPEGAPGPAADRPQTRGALTLHCLGSFNGISLARL